MAAVKRKSDAPEPARPAATSRPSALKRLRPFRMFKIAALGGLPVD